MRIVSWKTRRAIVWAIPLTAALLFRSDPVQSDPRPPRCRLVRGTFTDTFLSGATDCPDSPIQLCTRGELKGDLEGTYDFNFTEETPLNLQAFPNASAFKGHSIVTTSAGVLESNDQGVIQVNTVGESPFFNQIHFVKGTEEDVGVTGDLLAIGKANFSTGAGSGTYDGFLCRP